MPLAYYVLLNAQPRDKTYRLFDGLGLYLEISPRGGKWWRLKYRFGGREQRLALGTFPAVALKTARQRCIEARAQIAAGINPSAERKLAKRSLPRKDESFEAIAREWYASFSQNWTPTHGDRILRRLETYVFPWVGKVPIREVTAMEVTRKGWSEGKDVFGTSGNSEYPSSGCESRPAKAKTRRPVASLATAWVTTTAIRRCARA